MSNYLFLNQEKSAEMLVPLIPVDYNLQAQNDRLIYVPLATRNNFGVVKIGDGLTIEHGLLSFDRTELDVKLSTNVGSENAGKFLYVSDTGNIVFVDQVQNVTKISELENDVGYITNDVDDLHNYYDIDAINVKFEDVMTLSDTQLVSGIKIFTETIGLLNADGTLDRIRHINNNFLIVDQNGTALLDIDEGFRTIKSFGKELAFVEDIPNLSDVPTKVSDLINDTGFITNTVDNLVNYYSKNQTYTKDEVNTLVNNISSFNAKIVDELPTTNISPTTIYLINKTDSIDKDYYDEYLYINFHWEMIGHTYVDLWNYYSKEVADSLFVKHGDLPTNHVTTDTQQTITAQKRFNKILVKEYYGENGSLIAKDNTDNSVELGDYRYDLDILSKTRPKISIQDELVYGEIALKSEIPTDYAKLSDIPDVSEFITQTTLDNNYFTSGEVLQQISTEISKIRIPTKLSELDADTNNQRVSSAEKTTWNNKSDFSGSYYDLTNKPTGLLTANNAAEITGAKTFTGRNLQVTTTSGQQPTYLFLDDNNEIFKIDGVAHYMEVGYDGDTPIIRLLDYDIATKDDIPDVSQFITKNVNDLTNYYTQTYITTNFALKSEIPDTSGFITNTVNNLLNYYLKSETYTKEEVNAIFNSIKSFNAEIVTELPTSNISTTTIYLVAKTDTENNDYYDEYLYINNVWEMIGNTKIDLTNYYTKDESISLFAKQSDLNTTNANVSQNTTNIANRYTKAEVNNLIKDFITKEVNNLTNYYTSAQIDAKGYLTSVPSNYVTITDLSSKNYATVNYVDGAFTLISDLRTDLTALEETVEGLAGSSDLSDRVSTLETNQELIGAEVEEHDLQIIDLQNNKVSVQTWSTLSTNVSTNTSDIITLKATVKNKTSELENDSGFITNTVNNLSNYYTKNATDLRFAKMSAIPNKVSELENDSGFITSSDLPDTSKMVTTDTTQTISGAKTFTGSIIVPDVTIS